MRIVAGRHRGRTLVAPKGQSTRPTADRVREAMFNVVEHAPWSPGLRGARVVDLFAGSGALGLEALSRGAAFCLFVDSDATAREAIDANVAALRLGGESAVDWQDATRLRALAGAAPFDLAILDPPYGQGLRAPALVALAAGGWLASGAIALAEGGAGEADLEVFGYERLDVRDWGAARVSFLRLTAGRTASQCPPA
ncbi:MAG: 16S rRNA (guanine(966)-N(2))-methyltransferase RsmD [Caulobacteraceae bacterium]